MTDPSPGLTAAIAERYRVERALGAGGMANVYLAHDLRHDRKVALKVLRAELAAAIGAERFLREIRTTANLQHPHILGLLDSGQTDGQLWYTMPFVDGESLRDRLIRETQLPVRDAIQIAQEVADALDYAHRHGIIHRDIKPENILLHDGRALVADFGIALAAGSGGPRMTETGLSLGTPQYMSPEQAMGEREITARSDVYALGCVLYEMLLGHPPFTGPSAQAIIAGVLTGEPRSLVQERRSVPPHVEAAVLQALEKLPADRFASAAEFAAALGDRSFRSTVIGAGVAARGWRTGIRQWLPWALAVSALGVLVYDRLSPTPPPPVLRFGLPTPTFAAWVDEDGSGLAISPDGSLLAYTGRDSTTGRRLFLRPLGRLDPMPIPGTEYGAHPFFSPDGRWIGFVRVSGLWRVPVSGGLPEPICLPPGPRGYFTSTWLERGGIVLAKAGIGLIECSVGGTVDTLLAADPGAAVLHPHALPGDRGLLFTIVRAQTQRLAVLDLRTREVKVLEVVGSNPQYVGSGYVVYTSPEGGAHAVRFGLQALEVRGEPVAIADDVPFGRAGNAMLVVSRSGTIVSAGRAPNERVLDLVDRQGRGAQLSRRVGLFQDPRFSPDGRRIAVSLDNDIWILEPSREALVRLSRDSVATRPAWSPDGRDLLFVRQRGGDATLRRIRADGTAPAESLLAWAGYGLWEGLYTRDGRSLIVRTVGLGARDIWLAPLDGSEPTPLVSSPAQEVAPALSPDGRWLAYSSDESGRYEIYVRAFPAGGERYLVSLDGGTEPVWSANGRTLFYRDGPRLISASIPGDGPFTVLGRTELFSNPSYEADPTHAGYDVAPDGQHFVMVRQIGGSHALTVTLNLFANLDGTRGAAIPQP
jgi:hypothetical protein